MPNQAHHVVGLTGDEIQSQLKELDAQWKVQKARMDYLTVYPEEDPEFYDTDKLSDILNQVNVLEMWSSVEMEGNLFDFTHTEHSNDGGMVKSHKHT